jgi:hypothetical protein
MHRAPPTRRCYAHYATLELYSATTKKITWKTVQDLNATLNFDEFLMWRGCVHVECS